eukprot:12422947-Karenia_brevis.AAC.1
MRIMCPGRAGVSVEEIAAEETTYTTPVWKGRAASTDVEPRDLSPEEVYEINKKYLALQAAFLAERNRQDPSDAVASAEQNLATQAHKNHAES